MTVAAELGDIVSRMLIYTICINGTYRLHVDGHGSTLVEMTVVVVYVVTVAGTVFVVVRVFVMVSESVSVSVTDTVW